MKAQAVASARVLLITPITLSQNLPQAGGLVTSQRLSAMPQIPQNLTSFFMIVPPAYEVANVILPLARKATRLTITT